MQEYFGGNIDIHHIFPKDWCVKRDIGARADSIINKTPLASLTNQMIGARSPSQYIPIIQGHAGIDDARMAQILQSHVIDPSSMLADDFEAFWKARENALLERIEKAMGKPVMREAIAAEEAEALDYEGEEEAV